MEFIELINENSSYYLILEFCDGGDLNTYLLNCLNNRVPEDEAIKILVDILKGYKVLIDNGIVHRDLKPENILIAKGKYKIADFGFSKFC